MSGKHHFHHDLCSEHDVKSKELDRHSSAHSAFVEDQTGSKCAKNVETAGLEMGDCFADCIAKVSHAAYLSLPKTGKPQQGQEWTLLSTVLQVY